MLLQDDSSGAYFPRVTSGFGYNKDDPTSNLFSRLDDFENDPEKFRAQDGAFHFKLCYPSKQKGMWDINLCFALSFLYNE